MLLFERLQMMNSVIVILIFALVIQANDTATAQISKRKLTDVLVGKLVSRSLEVKNLRSSDFDGTMLVKVQSASVPRLGARHQRLQIGGRSRPREVSRSSWNDGLSPHGTTNQGKLFQERSVKRSTEELRPLLDNVDPETPIVKERQAKRRNLPAGQTLPNSGDYLGKSRERERQWKLDNGGAGAQQQTSEPEGPKGFVQIVEKEGELQEQIVSEEELDPQEKAYLEWIRDQEKRKKEERESKQSNGIVQQRERDWKQQQDGNLERVQKIRQKRHL
eukprot:gnl/MRDRNA2_/MRDRNA2_121616_c0_seq1.p1 gnl/MRDRNA2_/MRDRNA2_121616_c0~~gnl/MRDRNA2_/MRDRNA2_121616_c0_seq1.p1  ORF type:complete len:276 (-),score=57.74 gnl/MRDRNA2_/MRDRNA2_121616_c0_seq1:44-871(-)